MTDQQFSADTRVFTFVVAPEGRAIRTTQFDTGKPPFRDPATFERAFSQVLDSVSPHVVPRVRITAASRRPIVLADPKREVHVVVPQEEMAPELVQAANRQVAQHPFAEATFLRVPR